MSDFAGARVALLESRLGDEMAGLVTRHGGVPLHVPAVREATLPGAEAVAGLLDAFAAGEVEIAAFLTGAGVRALCEAAERLGRQAELIDGLRRMQVAVRGPKPASALAKLGVSAALHAPEPYTTAELLAALTATTLAGVGVALVQYGERSAELSDALAARRARLYELCLYEWLLPGDLAPLQGLVRDIIASRVDAVAFTSQVQARHLFQIASGMGSSEALRSALSQRVVVASLAPTCAGALRALGVEPHVVPMHAKMGHLLTALAAHLQQLQ